MLFFGAVGHGQEHFCISSHAFLQCPCTPGAPGMTSVSWAKLGCWHCSVNQCSASGAASRGQWCCCVSSHVWLRATCASHASLEQRICTTAMFKHSNSNSINEGNGVFTPICAILCASCPGVSSLLCMPQTALLHSFMKLSSHSMNSYEVSPGDAAALHSERRHHRMPTRAMHTVVMRR